MLIVHVNGEKGFSGGEVQNFLLMERLRAAGAENVLLGRRGGRAAAEARARGFAVLEAPMRNGADFFSMLAMRRQLRALGPDVVHFHTQRAHVLGGWAAAGLEIPARVATRRMDYRLRRSPGVRFLYARAVDRVAVISEAVRREVLRLGVPEERVVLIPSAVDAGRFASLAGRGEDARREARAALGVEAARPAIATAAILHRRKGQDVLLDAVARLAARGVDAQLLLAGEGGERDALEAQARRLGIVERVAFLGRVDPIERLLGAAELFTLPSREEALGVAALEAMAAALPVVATRVGGLAESVVDGETGRLVPREDKDALADAFGELLGDEARRARMGEAAAARIAARYDAGTMAQSYRALYEELVGVRPASR